MRIQRFAIHLLLGVLPSVSSAEALFDMDAIRAADTLEIKVLQDWHQASGRVSTRQKLVSIHVGDLWPGQEYRVPVRMVVPVSRKAKGFHLTGSSTPSRLEQVIRPNAWEQELLEGGVGLVYTVVQEPGSYGQGRMAREAEARFAKTLNPRYKIQYWAWPATLMRAITTAYAEVEYFEPGKVALTGGSKNGASPSMAIIHDERMTAVHATVSPIWDSPLRLCDPAAREIHRGNGGKQRGFSGGHFGPNFNQGALDAGRTWEDLQTFVQNISDDVFVSRNLESLRNRRVDMLFHPGTHDFVAYDMAWGGAHHQNIPVYLGANTGHGKKGHPQRERDEANKAAFMLQHFFPDQIEGALLVPPSIETKRSEQMLKISVRFSEDAGEESGRIWWMFDRAPDGSPKYLSELIPNANTREMQHDPEQGSWRTEISLPRDASRIDIFSNHRKTIRYRGREYRTYISSPYTRVNIR